jgi:VIT1/CCC1 family predicted Fe2+/Mn2+ transporter
MTIVHASERILEPIERVSEVLFGLIMVLTFTGSLSVATAGRAEVRTMLLGALGCNLAWGVIDGLLYLLGRIVERGTEIVTLRAMRVAASPSQGHQLLASTLPPAVVSVLVPEQLERLRQRLAELPEPPRRPSLERRDFMGALAVCLVVFLSTLPVVLPFLFMSDALRALRISNAIAIAMLFGCGYSVGRMTNYHPLGTGLVAVVVGAALAAMTMALGG